MIRQITLPIKESSQVGEARRIGLSMAQKLGFKENDIGKTGIIITETAQNLSKFAKEGELLLGPLENKGVKGLEILSLDRGPGMENPAKCLTDGYSTSGSAGTGLGAIQRLSHFFEIYSVPVQGTALLSRIWAEPLPKESPSAGLETGAVCLPKPGEQKSGDAWAVDNKPGRCLIMIADGLGHGLFASEASGEAVKVFAKHTHLAPAKMLEAIHAGLRSTRGAAVAIAEVDTAHGEVRYSGVGNIAGFIFSRAKTYHMVSHYGIVGEEATKIREFSYPWPKGSNGSNSPKEPQESQGPILIMYSDGLTSHWNLDRYPGLMNKHPGLIAGVLYRDFCRGNDDVTVVVAREAKKR